MSWPAHFRDGPWSFCGDGRTWTLQVLTRSLGEELRLTIRGMFETAVGDGFE